MLFPAINYDFWQVIDYLQPDPDEIVITKTSSSVFTTTNIDTVLRNLDVRYLILAGVLTDQCVESAVRDACDLNYLVTLVTGNCLSDCLKMSPYSSRPL